MVDSGLFRQDLLYRINTISIELPPLRERGNDILLLAEFYLKKYGRKYNRPGLKISRSAKQRLMSYHWPGNVRELQHAVEKAVILTDSDILDADSFSQRRLTNHKRLPFQTIEEMEKEMILVTMKAEKGNLSAVAKKLGITRQTLYNKLKKYGV